MSLETSETESCIDKRTRRACVEAMVVHPHGSGSGMFDVYNESGERYVVDLRDDVCECGDFTHREPAGGCKHLRRVRLEFALAPYVDVPAGIRSEHAAPTDVELARRRRGIDVDDEPEPVEPEPATVTVSDAKPARRVMADGGQLLEGEPRESGGEDTDAEADAPVHLSVGAHRIASEAIADADGQLPDFDVFCTVVECTQDTLLREVPG